MIAALCALILLALTGCQLAQENAGTNPYEDRLIGIFVTTEYLDLFNFEGYFNDNLRGFQGGSITIDGNTQKYEGRLYATLTTRTLTNEETGETSEIEEYVFEGIEGISYFSPTIPATADQDSYTASVSDEAISDGHRSINYGDDKNSTTLEVTIYASPSSKKHTYFFNPVYQSADGSVYFCRWMRIISFSYKPSTRPAHCLNTSLWKQTQNISSWKHTIETPKET